jgi:outer membrane protein
LIELSQSNANYVQAQSNRVQALYNFIFQEQLLDYYIGRLDTNIEF